MPTADDLVGLGMPAQVSEILGGNPNALTGAGTTQADAAKVLTKNTELSGASNSGVVIPTTASVMRPYYFYNSGANSVIVYAPVGGTLNSAASTTGLTIATHKGAILWQYKKGAWASILTA